MADLPHWQFLPLSTQPMYFDDAFRNVLEDNLFYIRSLADTKQIPIDPGLAYRYEFDLYGLLASQNVPNYMFWLIMRLTGMTSPDQLTRETQYYYLPDEMEVERIRGVYSSSLK